MTSAAARRGAVCSGGKEGNLRFWQFSARKTRRPQNVVRSMVCHKSRFCPSSRPTDRPTTAAAAGVRPGHRRAAALVALVVVCRKEEEEEEEEEAIFARSFVGSDRK